MAATLVKESTELKSTCDVEQMTLSLDRTKKLAQKMTVDIEGILGQLPLSARDKQILRLVPIANQLSSLSQRLDKVRQDDQRSKELTRRASVIYDTFHETKNNVIGKIYDSIQEDVRRFYEALHPGEGHGNFQMQLDTERRASTELLIDSFGRGDFDPRALSSDGHLDSLGLCIFLAFAKSFAESSKFMVLDDVIMSIDSSHRSRVAALLLNEFSEWQIIITTHDEIWFEEFRRHQQAYKAEGKFSNLRITGWSLDEGPLIEGCRSSWEQIESKLGDADKKGAGNAGRQYLEWVLRELCITSQTSLPAKRHPRYTADEMLPPLQDRLTKLLPEKTNEIKWTPSSGQR